ncbi:MAG: hypothetical protein KY446_12025 [Proteobacteria bacterium]|nr:hypothetical protein [Pseudomonadota bacterium]
MRSVSVGGSDWKVIERRAAGAPVRIAYRGQFGFRPEALADMLVRVVEADHAYWGDAAQPFFVPVVPLAAQVGSYSLGGTGRDDAFSVYASPNVREAELRLGDGASER